MFSNHRLIQIRPDIDNILYHWSLGIYVNIHHYFLNILQHLHKNVNRLSNEYQVNHRMNTCSYPMNLRKYPDIQDHAHCLGDIHLCLIDFISNFFLKNYNMIEVNSVSETEHRNRLVLSESQFRLIKFITNRYRFFHWLCQFGAQLRNHSHMNPACYYNVVRSRRYWKDTRRYLKDRN